VKLNIGCAANMFPHWENLDKVDQSGFIEHMRGIPNDCRIGWPAWQVKLSDDCKAGRIECTVKDLRKGFDEYPSDSVDAIYLGQMIEHLNPIYEAPAFLVECFRMLKPGGKIRITTPDLTILLDAYQKGELGKFAFEQPAFYANALPEAQLSYLMFGACGPECTTDKYEGHFAIYTPQWLGALLQTAGFELLSGDKSSEFAECVDMGMSHSMGIEAVKP